MWSRLKLHVGKFSDNRGSFIRTQRVRKLCRSYMVFSGYEHADVDYDLVYRPEFDNIMGYLPPGPGIEIKKIKTNELRIG